MFQHRFMVLSILLTLVFVLSAPLLGEVRATGENNTSEEEEEHCWEEFWEDGPSGFWMMPMMFGMIMIVFVIVLLLRTQTSIPSQRSTAIDTLQSRYARGEINREEYLRIFEDLK